VPFAEALGRNQGRALPGSGFTRLSKAHLLFLAALIMMGPTRSTWCEESFTDRLNASGACAIDIRTARALEARLGQLFIVNVDGFGYSGPLAVHPSFVEMVKRLQVGGVIPHYGSSDFERIRRTNRALAALTRLPLLVCCDIVTLSSGGRTARFGDGYVGGFIGKHRGLADGDFQTLAALNAFVFSALGMNTALGPTVDTSAGEARVQARARTVTAQLRRFGIEPVLKHFPFLPKGANLHRESRDTLVPVAEAARRVAVFRELAGEGGILMTTHTFDSLVDKGSIVTFSPAWLELLRRETRYGGLLMTDGLLMLRNYAEKSVLGTDIAAPAINPKIDETASWALRALLAGHDLIIVEGSAAITTRVFEGLLRIACGNTETGKQLRERIERAYERVVRFKEAREELLRRQAEVPAAAIAAAVALVPGDQDPAKFRFDAAATARIQPELERAAARRQLFPALTGWVKGLFRKER